MKSLISVLLAGLIVMPITISCDAVTSRSTEQVDSVATELLKLSDTTSFVKANGEKCDIYADATIHYPIGWGQNNNLAALQQWFVTQVLDAPDSLTLQQAMTQSVVNTMHQYDMTTAQSQDESLDDGDGTEAVYRYNTSTNITVYGQQHGVLTMCKVEKVMKNGQVTSITHRYYNFDLVNAVAVELGKMFRDDAMSDVCQLLKKQLLSQNKATSDEQLNELGFFNADNLTVTRNFFFDEGGVTWSYLPNELAVEAVGEPRISLSYELLKTLASDGSILNRFD